MCAVDPLNDYLRSINGYVADLIMTEPREATFRLVSPDQIQGRRFSGPLTRLIFMILQNAFYILYLQARVFSYRSFARRRASRLGSRPRDEVCR